MSKVTRRRALVGMILPALVVTALPASAASVAAEPDSMAQAEVYAKGYLDAKGEAPAAYDLDAYEYGREHGRREVELVRAPAAVVAGALFDFMGYLTMRDEPVIASRSHTVYALMDAYKAWAKERGIWDTTGADVIGWRERLEPFPNVQAATPEQGEYERLSSLSASRRMEQES